MTAAEKEGQLLICCTFDCGSDFSFHEQMYEEVYNNYYYFILLNKGKNVISGYIIYSDKLIGKRFLKEATNKILFVYYINVDRNTFSGYALVNDETKVELYEIEGVFVTN